MAGALMLIKSFSAESGKKQRPCNYREFLTVIFGHDLLCIQVIHIAYIVFWMVARMLIFFFIMSAVLSLACAYIARRIVTVSGWTAGHKGFVYSLAAAFVVFELAVFFAQRRWNLPGPLLDGMQWSSYFLLGLMATVFLYLVVGDLLLVLFRLFAGKHAIMPFFARFLPRAAVLLALVSCLIGLFQALQAPRVRTETVVIKGLPHDFAGFKISHLSDLHIGAPNGAGLVESAVNISNGLDPDIVVITGDLVDGTVGRILPKLAGLKNLESKYGVYFCPGNHEYYWNYEAWMPAIEGLGIKVLANTHHVISAPGGTRIILGGVTDHDPDAAKAFAGAPTGAPRVLLSHHPALLDVAAAQNTALLLSGHTHGGQFFPWWIFLAATHKHYRGLGGHAGMHINISSGTGFWGPPNRFMIPAEVVLVTLKAPIAS